MESVVMYTYIQGSVLSPSFQFQEWNWWVRVILLYLMFWGTSCQLFSAAATLFYMPTNNAQGFSLSPPCQYLLLSFVVCLDKWFSDYSQPSRYEGVAHCGFDLHFPSDEWCWVFFPGPTGHAYIFPVFLHCQNNLRSIFFFPICTMLPFTGHMERFRFIH